MRRTTIAPYRVAALLTLIVLAGCRNGGTSSSIVASGHVEATEVRVSSKVPGRLQAVEHDEGTASPRETSWRGSTRPTSRSRSIRLGGAVQAQAELDLRLAGARKEDIAELEALVASARADLSGAQKDLDRMEALLERGSGTAKARTTLEPGGTWRRPVSPRPARHSLARGPGAGVKRSRPQRPVSRPPMPESPSSSSRCAMP